MLKTLITLLPDLVKALASLLKSKPNIKYSRTPVTRQWIATYKGSVAVGDTRAEAAQRVLVQAAERDRG